MQIVKFFLFVSIVSLVVPLSAASILEGWYNPDDRLVLNSTQYTVRVSSDREQVILQSISESISIEQPNCRRGRAFEVCYNDSRINHTVQVYLIFNELRPDITVFRSNSTITAYPWERKTYDLTIQNNGTLAAQIRLNESYPPPVTVSTRSPCSVQQNRLTIDRRLNGRSSITCRVTLQFNDEMSATIRSRLFGSSSAASFYYDVPELSLQTQSPVAFSTLLGSELIDVNRGRNSSYLEISLNNSGDQTIQINIRMNVEPNITVRATPFTKNETSYFFSRAYEPGDDDIFNVTFSHDAPVNVSFFLFPSYVYRGQTFRLSPTSVKTSFSDLNASETSYYCRPLNKSDLNSAVQVDFYSENGTALLANKGTMLEIRLNNSANDSYYTDLLLNIYRDDELLDRVRIPYFPQCSQVRLPSVFVLPKYSDSTTSVVTINGTGFIGTARTYFQSSFNFTHEAFEDISIESIVPDYATKGSRVLREVTLSKDVEGDVPVYVFDQVSGGVTLAGISEANIILSDDAVVLSYFIDIPADYPQEYVTINTTAIVSALDSTHRYSVLDIINISGGFENTNVTFVFPDVESGELGYANITITNNNNATITNASVFLNSQHNAHWGQKEIGFGTLDPQASRTVIVAVRLFGANESVSFSLNGKFTGNGRVYSLYPSNFSLDLSGDSSDQSGLTYNSSTLYDADERIYKTRMIFTNFDAIERTIHLPYVELVSISEEANTISIPSGQSKTLLFSSLNFEPAIFEDITYDYFGTQLYLGVTLPAPPIEQSNDAEENSHNEEQSNQQVQLVGSRQADIGSEASSMNQQNVVVPVHEQPQAIVIVSGERKQNWTNFVWYGLASGLVVGAVMFFIFRKKSK